MAKAATRETRNTPAAGVATLKVRRCGIVPIGPRHGCRRHGGAASFGRWKRSGRTVAAAGPGKSSPREPASLPAALASTRRRSAGFQPVREACAPPKPGSPAGAGPAGQQARAPAPEQAQALIVVTLAGSRRSRPRPSRCRPSWQAALRQLADRRLPRNAGRRPTALRPTANPIIREDPRRVQDRRHARGAVPAETSSTRLPIPPGSRMRKRRCARSRRAIRFMCPRNTRPTTSSGRPKPSISTRRGPDRGPPSWNPSS